MSSNELMYMNWRELQQPETVKVSSTDTYGKFVCEPLERGYGTTIGNALRRILLSSLYGAAIVSIKLEGVLHEYSVLPNILEDVSEIILNIKGIRLRVPDAEPKTLKLNVEGEGIVTAADIVTDDPEVEILNKDHHIATLSAGAKFEITFVANTGKGYSLAAENKYEDAPVGTIFIDSVFSPIKRVKYVISNARLGQRTDYDKLTLEVSTDGSLKPDDAVAYASKILKEQLSAFINFDENLEPEPEVETETQPTQDFNDNLYRNVEELELSVRSANCLKNAEIVKIYQLVQKTEAEMLKTKIFGRKSLNEIKEVLNEMGLSLGMKLEGFVQPEEIAEEGE